MGKVLVVIFLLLVSAGAFAAEKPQSELKAVEAEIARQKALELEMRRNEGSIQKEIAALKRDMVALASQMRKKEDEAGQLEREIAVLQKREDAAMARLALGRRRQEELAVSLVRLGRLPPEMALLGPGDVGRVIEGAVILKGVEPELERGARNIERELDELRETRSGIAQRQESLKPVLAELAVRREDLAALSGKRRQSYDSFGQQRRQAKEAQEKLARQAKDLRDLMKQLEKERLARQKKLVGTGKTPSGSLPPAVQPVSGPVARFFGDKDAYGASQQGISITAPASGTVVAPMEGRIVFAGPFRSYKHLLIIEGGGGYHALLSGLARIDASVGEDVSRGEPVGMMGAAGNAAPELYFELRKDGEPVDPAWVLAAAGKRRK
ncbi:MAG TPA: hypothetical protein DCW68_05420 [Rhodospirillaceae bacterium]|nr:MAG: hypothetical protein A2018_02230 [Alphaproteobacteria bacterium GWF2_58_20]HAU29535.1 hypothetical protein [Rhodospirillaceae bacterium]